MSGFRARDWAISYIPLFVVLTYPLFCTYNFSNSTLASYDFLSMNGNVLWFVLIVVGVTIIGLYRKDDISFASLLAIVLLFSLVELYTNYPSLIWRDVFLDGSAVKGIAQRGYVGGAWLTYPQTQPGFFLLWTIFTVTTGMDVIQSNLFVLLPVTLILSIALIRFVCRKLSINRANSVTLFAFLLMNFNTNEFMFMHFNTRLLAFVYVLVFMLFFLLREGRTASIALLTTGLSLIISHILVSLVPIAFVALTLFSRLKPFASRMWLFVSLAALYFAWNSYVGQSLLSVGITGLFNVYYIQLALEITSRYSPLQAKPEPFFGFLLRGYDKILLVILGIASAYSALKSMNETWFKVMWNYFLAVLFVFGLSFFVLTWISVDRGVLFISIALAALPSMFLLKRVNSDRNGWKRKLFVLAIVLLIIPQYILVHEPSAAIWGTNPSSQQTYSFVLNLRGGQQIASLGDFPLSYTFFEPFYQGYQILNGQYVNQTGDVTNFFLTRPENVLKIVDQTRDFGSLQPDVLAQSGSAVYVYSKLDQRFNIVYSNGFETIYV